MTVLRRLVAVLEDSKQGALEMKATLDKAGVVEQDQALRHAAQCDNPPDVDPEAADGHDEPATLPEAAEA